ncbi:MAG: hypothetical protein KDD43_06285, partial [Bdellovibrionales bacterium]|nr:hypothetical protein [Bdellovibrionales bacterium]
MGRVFKGLIIFVLAEFSVFSTQSLACEAGMEVPGEFLVRFQPQASAFGQGKGQADPASLLASLGIPFEVIHSGQASRRAMAYSNKIIPPQLRPALYHLKNFSRDLNEVRALPGTLSVEPNCYVRPLITANDAEYSNQWAHQV